MYSVVCAKHIIVENFRPQTAQRAVCKKWFQTYQEQNPGRHIKGPLDTWRSNYGADLAAITRIMAEQFTATSREPISHFNDN